MTTQIKPSFLFYTVTLLLCLNSPPVNTPIILSSAISGRLALTPVRIY